MRGSPSIAMGPGTEWSTGTSRTAMTCTAKRWQTALNSPMNLSAHAASLGRNTSPVPYLPGSGTGMPSEAMNL